MASRESLKVLCKHLNGRHRQLLSRALAGGQGSRGLGFGRSVSSSAHCESVSSNLEVKIEMSDPAPGFQAFGASVTNVPRFSVPFKLPPAATPVGKMDAVGLSREMSSALSHQKMEEAVRLYDDWITLTDAEGNPNKPNLLVYNLLLHAKLRLGAPPDVMHQIVDEMEKKGVTPTQLTYNFLLRSVFRQRDSKAAEFVLYK